MATLAFVAVFALLGENQPIQASEIKSDERVVFFPTAAHLSRDGTSWEVPIHGWIFEPEANDLLRRTLLAQALRLSPVQSDGVIFQERAGLFLRDNGHGKRIGIRIGQKQVALEPSAPDGHFAGTVSISVDDARATALEGWIHFSAVLGTGDARRFDGKARLVEREGLSIVSDIDDTIKVTEVRDRAKLIENTFMRPFRPVEGMAETYRKWADEGAVFHFVSSSPWQLYEPLSQFARTDGFPQGTFHLKRVRINDFSILKLFANAKEPVIDELIVNYPQRRFILVGDSGQRDPEVYGNLGRQYPERVAQILIRDVTPNTEDLRYQKAFADLPEEKWRVFTDPAQIKPSE